MFSGIPGQAAAISRRRRAFAALLALLRHSRISPQFRHRSRWHSAFISYPALFILPSHRVNSFSRFRLLPAAYGFAHYVHQRRVQFALFHFISAFASLRFSAATCRHRRHSHWLNYRSAPLAFAASFIPLSPFACPPHALFRSSITLIRAQALSHSVPAWPGRHIAASRFRLRRRYLHFGRINSGLFIRPACFQPATPRHYAAIIRLCTDFATPGSARFTGPFRAFAIGIFASLRILRASLFLHHASLSTFGHLAGLDFFARSSPPGLDYRARPSGRPALITAAAAPHWVAWPRSRAASVGLRPHRFRLRCTGFSATGHSRALFRPYLPDCVSFCHFAGLDSSSVIFQFYVNSGYRFPHHFVRAAPGTTFPAT